MRPKVCLLLRILWIFVMKTGRLYGVRLWRDTQLNHIYGLFEVTDGIYQVRGYDMSNVTFIKGDTGWIVVDPLMSVECAQAAFALVEENLGTFPVKAVIYSHSHVDHFGGVKGIVSEEEV